MCSDDKATLWYAWVSKNVKIYIQCYGKVLIYDIPVDFCNNECKLATSKTKGK